MGGKLGVNIFMFISGYYLIDSKKVKINKLLRILCQALLYSLVITFIFFITGNGNISIIKMIGAFFPISTSEWWFATAYIVIYLLHPYINTMLYAIGKKGHLSLLLTLTVIWCLYPTFIGGTFEGHNISYLLYVYVLASYIKLYKNDIENTKYIWYGIIIYAFIFISIVIFEYTGFSNPTRFAKTNSLFIILSSLFIFIGFKNVEVKSNKMINTIASTTFGVYLLHDFPMMRSVIWDQIINGPMYQDSLLLIPYSILTCLSLFIVCSIIDFIRISTIEKSLNKLFGNLAKKIEFILAKILDFVDNKV